MRDFLRIFSGVYILQNTMARGEGKWCRGKNEVVRKKKEKGERKRGRVIFFLIYGTLLLIIVY